jgi:hypothetical protein
MDYEGPVDEYGYNHSFVLFKEYGNYVLHVSEVGCSVDQSGCIVAHRVQRSSVGSALAFCMIGSSSNLSMVPQGGFSPLSHKQ